MANKKQTRRALWMSVISLILCCTMFVGTTFAWFTDGVTSGKNQIVAGNLDVELEYATVENGTITGWNGVADATEIFDPNALWEPGRVEVAYLKVSNLGTLALKYQLGVNVSSETPGISVETKKEFKLSDYLVFKVVEMDDALNTYTDREAVQVAAGTEMGLKDYNGEYKALDPKDGANDEDYVALIVYMPESVGNEANYRGIQVPQIELGVNLFATQKNVESDSFGPDYDEQAPELTVEVTPADIQEYLDGQHGDLTNVVLQLTPGNYGVLNLGRPTKYAGSNTAYTCTTHDFVTNDAEAFVAHLAETGYHTTPKYTTTMQNVTIQGVEGANVAGVLATSGHCYGDVYDYVRDIDYEAGSAYYSTLNMKNVTFKDVTFTGQINLNTSDVDSVYDGVTFDGCSFTTGGTDASNGAAIRFYNEANNGKVRNITVTNCSFTNCYQGVYVHNSNGVTITDNTFDITGHNAIAMQSADQGAVNLKNVVIKNNIFKNIGDRVVRFGDVGADTNITMEYNLATNSGDEDDEVVKATTLAAGIKVTANYNDWGGTVVNPELRDEKTAKLTVDATGFKSAATSANPNPGEPNDVILMDDIMVEDLTYVNFAEGTVINGNGNSLVRDTASGNPLLVNTTNKVVFEDVVFESTKGSAVLATRKVGANIEVNNCVFQNYEKPSTGNTGVQVYANDVTMVFNNCTFNNMPIETNSSYPTGIKLVFNNCTFNWEGDNCPGFIKIANYLEITVDLNNCTMNYTTNSQYTTAKTMISYNWPEDCTININGLKVVGTRNNDKIWKICSSNNKVTINTTGVLSYTFNGETIDFATYLK